MKKQDKETPSCATCGHIQNGICDIHNSRLMYPDENHGCSYWQPKCSVCPQRCGICSGFIFTTPAETWGICNASPRIREEIHKNTYACNLFYKESEENVSKKTYYTKCGREFQKSSTAVVTGYNIDLREDGSISEVYQILKEEATEALLECTKCPFKVMITEGYPPIFKRWECRAGSEKPNHSNDWTGSTEDKNTIGVNSLDNDFLESIIEYCNEQADVSANYNADHLADCRRTLTITCSANKKGIAAKKALIEKFFLVTASVSEDIFEEDEDEQKCRVCGCTENNACEGGCYWVEDDLCNKCAENTCEEVQCPFNNGYGSCCFNDEDPQSDGYHRDVIGAVDGYGCKNKDVQLAYKAITNTDFTDIEIDTQQDEYSHYERGKSMIQNIQISKICPHPDNPRKDLGDLSELADSIKAQGVLQNLLVVPYLGEVTGQPIEGLYRAVIGHRRLAAAKLAGLTEVPCVISNMSHREQVATMLLENMQRNDLTVYEQAQGFQMMIDLGETMSSISEQTGFSETTVRRRVKLLELDQEKFKKSVERGATLMDYAELEKINDINLRNKVLEKIGTPNFKWKLQYAIDKEKSEKNKTLLIAELEKFATKVNNVSGLQYVNSFYPSQGFTVTTPEDAATTEYFFAESVSSSYITLYKKIIKSQPEDSQKEAANQKEIQERRTVLDEISKRAYQLRSDFVRDISNAIAKKNISIIIEYQLRNMFDCYFNVDLDDFTSFLNIEIDEDDGEWNYDSIANRIATQQEKNLLVVTYLALDSSNEHYYDWNNQHKDNENLNTVYDFLKKLGYEMSDEERSLRDGTHELFH